MVKPDIWGRYIWASIHLIILGYPENPTMDVKKQYYDYFHSLSNVLPCPVCSAGFKQILQQHPLTDNILSDKELFIKWGIDVHNIVNKKLGKPVLSYDEAIADIQRLGKSRDHNQIWLYVLVAMITIAIVGYYMWKN